MLPDGAWQVELSDGELLAAGAKPGVLHGGTYTWTFDGTRARVGVAANGRIDYCSAEASRVEKGVLFTYLANLGCGGWQDTISWAIEMDGLHLTLVDSTAPLEDNAPYLQAKPWQPVPPEPIPAWPSWSAKCEPGCQGPISSGTFTSTGLIPGLELTFNGSADWFNSRDDQDELEFDLGESALRIWGNPRAASPNGDPVDSIPSTQAALIDWFVTNKNIVVSRPQAITLGDGIKAKTFTVRIADDYVNADPECPVRSCLDMLWVNQDHAFGVGYGSAERFYLFTLKNGDLIVVSIDTADQAALDAVQPKLDALLATLRVPGA